MKDYVDYLEKIFHGKLDLCEAENEITILHNIYKISKFNIIMYGTGSQAFFIYNYLKQREMKINYVVDVSSEKNGTMFEGIPIISIENIKQLSHETRC